MGVARANAIIKGIDADKPLYCRVTFIEGLAALCKLYPNEVDRKVTGTSKEVKKVLWAACSPERLEWLFNGARMRHSLTPAARILLPSGTSSNEALHAQINSWSKSIRNLHQSTLRLKLEIMHFGKLLAHHVCCCYPALRQPSESIVLARSLSYNVWHEDAWKPFCQGTVKASLPMHEARRAEVAQVKEWVMRRPAAQKVRKANVKRSTTTVRRRHSVLSSGRRPQDKQDWSQERKSVLFKHVVCTVVCFTYHLPIIWRVKCHGITLYRRIVIAGYGWSFMLSCFSGSSKYAPLLWCSTSSAAQ